MSVLDITPIKSHVYTGVGVYEFDFKTYLSTDLVCTVLMPDGSTRSLVKDTDYSVSIAAEPIIGGSVTILIDSNPTAIKLYILREMPFTQDVDWENGGPLDQPLLTRSMDKITMLLQQMRTTVSGYIAQTVWRGAWATDVRYVERDLLLGPNGSLYTVVSAHISGVFATDLAAGRLALVLDRTAIVAEISALTRLPDPSTGQPEQAVIVNPTSTGYVLGDGSGGLKWLTYSTNQTTAKNKGYGMDTTSGALTVTLHATPTVGDTVGISDVAGTFAMNNCTIARNGSLIAGAAADYILEENSAAVTLVYTGATYGWVFVNHLTATYPKTVLNKPFFHAQDQKAYNVDGGTSIADAWTKRDLNTVITNDIQGASLASNAVNLPAGTYFVKGSAQFGLVTGAQTTLAVFKDGAKAVQGQTMYGALNTYTEREVSGVVVMSTPGVIDLRYYVGAATGTYGLGQSNNSGSITDAAIPSIYADLKIWQLDRSLEIAPVAVNGPQTSIPNVRPASPIGGLDITTSGQVITVTPGACKDSTDTIPMAITTNKTWTVPSTNNLETYLFLVRLVADGSFDVKGYSTLAGPSSDPLVDYSRLISWAKNNGSGVLMPYRQVGDSIVWLTGTNLLVITSSTTSSIVSYSIDSILPSVLFKDLHIGPNSASNITVSEDMSTDLTTIPGSGMVRILSKSAIGIKHGSASAVVSVLEATLRR